MARMEGYVCDQCNQFAQSSNGFPSGWLTVVLPATSQDQKDDKTRELCSDKCLVKFARERERASRPPAGSRTSPEYAKAFEAADVKPSLRGIYVARHNRHKKNDELHHDCVLCEVDLNA